jgi:hypothetical protein
VPGLIRTAGFPLVGQSHGGPAFSSPRFGVVTSVAPLVFGGRPSFRPCGTRASGESPLVGLMPCGPVSAHHFSRVFADQFSAAAPCRRQRQVAAEKIS